MGGGVKLPERIKNLYAIVKEQLFTMVSTFSQLVAWLPFS